MKAPPDFGVDESALVKVVVPNDLHAAKVPERQILTRLLQCGYDEDTIFGIKLALEEALTNAVKHGNCNDGRKHITIRYSIDPQRAVVAIRDEGSGFCPDLVPDPTAEENLERPNGRGIMLMQSYMTKVRFNKAGNEVWLLKERTGAAP
ncbi:MAG: ATP-binding protein [Phycisphaerae bacterium]|jgi:serine/threonine-protein kinase RsbW